MNWNLITYYMINIGLVLIYSAFFIKVLIDRGIK